MWSFRAAKDAADVSRLSESRVVLEDYASWGRLLEPYCVNPGGWAVGERLVVHLQPHQMSYVKQSPSDSTLFERGSSWNLSDIARGRVPMGNISLVIGTVRPSRPLCGLCGN